MGLPITYIRNTYLGKVISQEFDNNIIRLCYSYFIFKINCTLYFSTGNFGNFLAVNSLHLYQMKYEYCATATVSWLRKDAYRICQFYII